MAESTGFDCRTCGSHSKKLSYTVKERMFGTKTDFIYDQCDHCDSIQIAEIPDEVEIASYYPNNYYSYAVKGGKERIVKDEIKAYLKGVHDRGLFGKSLAGRVIELIRPEVSPLVTVKTVGVRRDAKILDVGCGAGQFLDRLARIGFRNVVGVDPFLSNDVTTREGVVLYKRRLDQAPGSFDVIVFNHSFEHVSNPAAELCVAHEKTATNGLCLIQMPTPTSQAWEEYGTDWAQWDAPRHMTLMSRKGVASLATRCGFKLQRILDIAMPWSLMASELCKKGIPFAGVNYSEYFSRSQIAAFKRKAAASNAKAMGDSVSYVLVKQ